MVVYGNYRREGNKTVYAAQCERCMKEIGGLDIGELMALMSGNYGKVLCFECEQGSCPDCQCQLSERGKLDVEEFGHCYFCELQRLEGTSDNNDR